MMKSLKFLLITGLVVVSSSNLFSLVPPPVGGGNPGCWPPPCVPIDNGLLFLIIAGALYGAKKLYNASKKPVSNI